MSPEEKLLVQRSNKRDYTKSRDYTDSTASLDDNVSKANMGLCEAELEMERKIHQASVVTVMSDEEVCQLFGIVPSTVETPVATGAGVEVVAAATAAEGEDLGRQGNKNEKENGEDDKREGGKENEEDDLSVLIANLMVEFNAELERVQSNFNRELRRIKCRHVAKVRAADERLSAALAEKTIAETRAREAQKLVEASERENEELKALLGQMQETRALRVRTTPEDGLGRITRVASASASASTSTSTSTSTFPDPISPSLAGVGLHTLIHKEAAAICQSTECCGITKVGSTEHTTGTHDANNARQPSIKAPRILTNQYASAGTATSTSTSDGLMVSKYASRGGSIDRNTHSHMGADPRIALVQNGTTPTNEAQQLLVRTEPEKQGIASPFALQEIISALNGRGVVVDLGTNHLSIAFGTSAFNRYPRDLISIQKSSRLTNVASLLSNAEESDVAVMTGGLGELEEDSNTAQHKSMAGPIVHPEGDSSTVQRVSIESTSADGIVVSPLGHRAPAARAQPFMWDIKSCIATALAYRENIVGSRFGDPEPAIAGGLIASPRMSYMSVYGALGNEGTGAGVGGMVGGSSCNREISSVDGGGISVRDTSTAMSVFVGRLGVLPAAVGPKVPQPIQGVGADRLTEAGVSWLGGSGTTGRLGASSVYTKDSTLRNDVRSVHLDTWSDLGEACKKVKAAEKSIVVEAASQVSVGKEERVLVPDCCGEKTSGESGVEGAVEESVALEEASKLQPVSDVLSELTDALRRKNMVEKLKDETERRANGKTRKEARLGLGKEEDEAKRKAGKMGRLGRQAKIYEKDKVQRAAAICQSTECCGITKVGSTEHTTGTHDANNARQPSIKAPRILTNQYASAGTATSTSTADGLMVSKYASRGCNTDGNAHSHMDVGPRIALVQDGTMLTNEMQELLVRIDPDKQGFSFMLEDIMAALNRFQMGVDLDTNHISVGFEMSAFNRHTNNFNSVQKSSRLTNVASLLSNAEESDVAVMTGGLGELEEDSNTAQHKSMAGPIVHPEGDSSTVQRVSIESTSADGIVVSPLGHRAPAARAQPFMWDIKSCIATALAYRENIVGSRFGDPEPAIAGGLIASPRMSHMSVYDALGNEGTGAGVGGMVGGSSCNREISSVDGGGISVRDTSTVMSVFVGRLGVLPTAVGPKVPQPIQGVGADRLTEAGVSWLGGSGTTGRLGASSVYTKDSTLRNDVRSVHLDTWSDLGEACKKVKAAEKSIVVEAASQVSVGKEEGVLVPDCCGEKTSGEAGVEGAVEESVSLEEVSDVLSELTDALRRKNMVEKLKDETERRANGKTRKEARLGLGKEEDEAKRKAGKMGRLGRQAKIYEKDKVQRGPSTQEHDSQMVIIRGDAPPHPTDNTGNNDAQNTKKSLSSNAVSGVPTGPGRAGNGSAGAPAPKPAPQSDKSEALARPRMATPCGRGGGWGGRGHEDTGLMGTGGRIAGAATSKPAPHSDKSKALARPGMVIPCGRGGGGGGRGHEGTGPMGTGRRIAGAIASNQPPREGKSETLAGPGMAVPCVGGGGAWGVGHEGTGSMGTRGGTGRGGSTPDIPKAGFGVHTGRPAECDHAIAYVTTIKYRFSHEPQTYQTFLEILHAYKTEQTGMNDLLEGISSLFADHPDLLRKFIYFLPHRVQEQARERLDRAARESEVCKAKTIANAAKRNGRDHSGTMTHSGRVPSPHQLRASEMCKAKVAANAAKRNGRDHSGTMPHSGSVPSRQAGGPSHRPDGSQSQVMRGGHGSGGDGGSGGTGGVQHCAQGRGRTAKKKGNQAKKKKGNKTKKKDKKQARQQQPEAADGGKEMEVKVEKEKTASVGVTETHHFSFNPDVDASFLLSDPPKGKTVGSSVAAVSTPSSGSAGFTFSSGCRPREVSGVSCGARHTRLHLNDKRISRSGNGRVQVAVPPVGNEGNSEDGTPPRSDTNCDGADNGSQVFSLGTHLATRVAGKEKGRRPAR